jgi:hypothetical protein
LSKSISLSPHGSDFATVPLPMPHCLLIGPLANMIREL